MMVYRFNSPALYNVKASTEVGIRLLDAFDVKLVCEKTYSLFWADFFISRNCTYVIITHDDVTDQIYGLRSEFERNITKTLALKDNTVRFIPIDKDDVDKMGLEPDFSWWNKYGFLCISVLMYMCVVCTNKAIINANDMKQDRPAWIYEEKMMRYNARDWRCYAYHSFIFMFFIFPVVVIIRCFGLWL
jgi:hypothetical protein